MQREVCVVAGVMDEFLPVFKLGDFRVLAVTHEVRANLLNAGKSF